ncbi:MAG: hypothetical protein ACQESR_27290 [Planctomycetota bacterium]
MESCPTQAVLPLVGLAAEKVIRHRYGKLFNPAWRRLRCSTLHHCRGGVVDKSSTLPRAPLPKEPFRPPVSIFAPREKTEIGQR